MHLLFIHESNNNDTRQYQTIPTKLLLSHIAIASTTSQRHTLRPLTTVILEAETM